MDEIIDNSGCRLWTTSNGAGLPFVLCNGGPGCDDYLEPVSALIEDSCQVVRFEPRGCGRSDYDGNYAIVTTVEDVEFIRDYYGLEKIIIGGHSAGSDVALAYTLSYPNRVLGLVSIAGGRIVNDRDWSATYHRNLDEIGEDSGGKIFIADPAVNQQGNASWKQFIKKPDLLSDIRNIRIPAVFINAGDDIRPNWPTQQLAGLIPAGSYHEIAGATHYIWLTHAKELRFLLHQFLRNFAIH